MSDDYFFTRQSFTRGIARAVDIGGVLSEEAYLFSETPEAADARALQSDWARVAESLRAAMASVLPAEPAK